MAHPSQLDGLGSERSAAQSGFSSSCFIGIQTGLDQIKYLGVEAIAGGRKEQILFCLVNHSWFIKLLQAAVSINVKQAENLKHWDCLLQGLARQVEEQSSRGGSQTVRHLWQSCTYCPSCEG